jgi:glucose-6-phosphate 1-epimerase
LDEVMHVSIFAGLYLKAQGEIKVSSKHGKRGDRPLKPVYTFSSMDITALNANFGLAGVLSFEDHEGLTRAVVTTPTATATVYLQGAHIAEWQPAGEEGVLFLSKKTAYKKGKALRGGVPVIFPWFGDRHDGQAGPAHGFVRAADWEFVFAALVGDDLHMTLSFGANDATRALGFDHFKVAYEIAIGQTLTMKLTVANEADKPLVYEEALHTYYVVSDVRAVSTTGLVSTPFLDKRDGGREKMQVEDPLVLTWTTDRVYMNTTAVCEINDAAKNRRIKIAKSGSGTTIVWNPWSELTPGLADMEPEGWVGMLCVESGNAGPNAITLAPGETHTLKSVISVEQLD